MPRPPTPSLTLHIPSLHDSTPLETRIYLPSEFRVSTTPSSPSFRSTNVTFQDHNNSVGAGKRKRKAAIVAHPYAPLGGSFDDFVVMRLVELFLARGWVVGTFNFRGAGGSKGKTTWTGKAEVQDYVSVTAWLLAYIQALPPPPTAAATTTTLLLPSSINVSPVNLLPATAKSEAERKPGGGVEGEEEEEEVIQLILAGYSYGSLITANLPPTESIFSLLSQEDGLNKGFARSLDSARSCARRWWDSHATSRTSYSGPRSLDLSRSENFKATLAAEIAATEEDEDSHPEKGWKIITSYALISPLLPPVSSFLMGFGIGAAGGGFWNLFGGPGHHYHHHHHHHHKKGRKNPPPPVHEAAESIMDPSSSRHANLLAVYGDGDNFTAVKKYRKWNEKMLAAAAAAGTTTAMGRGNRIFKGVEVEGASHFWHEPGVAEDMEAAVVKWLATHA